MHIILGASGHVGSTVAERLLENGEQVKVILHDEKKAAEWEKKGATVALADVSDIEALRQAFKDGERLFMMMPPGDVSSDALWEENKTLDNYQTALAYSNIKKIVGLSSYGAQHFGGTGNLLSSYKMEHLFKDLPIKKSFVRPAYYFSNWDASLKTAKRKGVVHTFYPVEMKIPMVAPHDVGEFVAQIMLEPIDSEAIYHIESVEHYSSIDVAEAFAAALQQQVEAVEIKPDEWGNALSEMGFSPTSADEFIDMTRSVIDGRTRVDSSVNPHKGATTLSQYIDALVNA